MNYSEEDIDKFFEGLKQLPNNYQLDRVHELIKGFPLDVPRSQKFSKPFKFYFAMTTFIIAISISVFFLFNSNDRQNLQTSGNKGQEQIASPDNRKVPKDSLTNNEESSGSGASQQGQPMDRKISTITESAEDDDPNSFNESQPIKIQSTKNRIDTFNKNNKQPGVAFQGSKNEISCNWPADTVIEGARLEILLSDNELSELGFMINDTGIYYKNRFRDQTACFHDRFEGGGGEMSALAKSPHERNKKEHYSTHDFYPVFMTDFLYTPGRAVDGSQGAFNTRRDTLVPVRIKTSTLRTSDTDIIMWFTPTSNFFDALPTKYSRLQPIYSCLRSFKKRTGRSGIVSFKQKSLIRATQFLKPNKETLQRLGFELHEDRIIYKQRNETCSLTLTVTKFSQTVNIKDVGGTVRVADLNVVFLSDTAGRQGIKWSCQSSISKKRQNGQNFEKIHDLLVPVKLQKQNYPDLLPMDLIFWFEPSEALFNALPNDFGEQIKREYEYLISEPDKRKEISTSCTFFESCRSTLHLDEMRLFPNPARDQLNLHFRLHKEQFGSISLFTMGGVSVKELLSDVTIFPGKNIYEFDISGVPSGIYLLSVNTSEGFKTQRVIVQK